MTAPRGEIKLMQNTILPLRLGVNVDHVATIRQARGTNYPSPLTAALIAQAAGADSHASKPALRERTKGREPPQGATGPESLL